MLFAHGFGCDQNMWRFVAPRFEPDFKVVLFDHVGSGGSDTSAYDPARYSSLDAYAQDVVELCHELDLRDVIFVGHSVSSMMGVLAAINEPELFAKLVLVGPSPCYIDDGSYVGGFGRQDIDELLESLESNYLGWSSAIVPVIMGNPDRPELGEELTASFCRSDPEIARQFAKVTFLSDGSRLPVLVNSILERDDHGAPVVVRIAVFDATDRREYERELLRSKERAEASEARATLLARTLQQTLIPPTPPSIAGLDTAAVYRPAGSGDEVGGDFYDIFEIGSGDWVVVIGDVCGKGVEAAVVTALARHTIRAAAVHQHRPADILATLNAVLLHHPTDRFCTVTLLRLRNAGTAWTATVSRAGHPPALLWRTGAPPAPIGPLGSLLGVLPSPDLGDSDVTLQSGDSLLLYTDGVTEGRRAKDFFGEEKLAAAIPRYGQSAAALAEGVLDEVMAFQEGNPRDDIAIVAVRIP